MDLGYLKGKELAELLGLTTLRLRQLGEAGVIPRPVRGKGYDAAAIPAGTDGPGTNPTRGPSLDEHALAATFTPPAPASPAPDNSPSRPWTPRTTHHTRASSARQEPRAHTLVALVTRSLSVPQDVPAYMPRGGTQRACLCVLACLPLARELLGFDLTGGS